MTREEAIQIIKKNKPTTDPRLCGEELCEACDMAIEALEKQMPKKPFNDRLTTRKFCPSCKKKLRIFIDRENDFFGGYERVSLHSNCCEECGQALDWSEA